MISVVVPTFNRADRLSGLVEELLAQSLEEIELVIVDDGSTDHTPAVLERITDPRVRIVHQENRGLSAARNAGAAVARSDLVVFLDDDDRADRQWLARLVTVMSRPRVAVVAFGARLVDVHGELIRVVLPSPLGPAFDGVTANAGLTTYCVRQDVLTAVGGYAEGLGVSHQTELALRLLPYCVAHGLEVVAWREPLISIERRPAGDRPEATSTKLLQGSSHLLTHHGERLARDPHRLADYLGVAGVAAARLGDYRQARRHLVRAVRLDPTPKRLGRLGFAFVPALGRRVWGTASTHGDAR